MAQRGGFGNVWFGGVSYAGAIPSGSVVQTSVNGVVRIQKTQTTQITGQTRIQHTNTETIQGAVRVEKTNTTTIGGQVNITTDLRTSLDGVVRIAKTSQTTPKSTVFSILSHAFLSSRPMKILRIASHGSVGSTSSLVDVENVGISIVSR